MSTADRLSPWPGFDMRRDTPTRRTLESIVEALAGRGWHDRRAVARSVAARNNVGVNAVQRLISGAIQMGGLEASRSGRIRLALPPLPTITETTDK